MRVNDTSMHLAMSGRTYSQLATYKKAFTGSVRFGSKTEENGPIRLPAPQKASIVEHEILQWQQAHQRVLNTVKGQDSGIRQLVEGIVKAKRQNMLKPDRPVVALLCGEPTTGKTLTLQTFEKLMGRPFIYFGPRDYDEKQTGSRNFFLGPYFEDRFPDEFGNRYADKSVAAQIIQANRATLERGEPRPVLVFDEFRRLESSILNKLTICHHVELDALRRPDNHIRLDRDVLNKRISQLKSGLFGEDLEDEKYILGQELLRDLIVKGRLEVEDGLLDLLRKPQSKKQEAVLDGIEVILVSTPEDQRRYPILPEIDEAIAAEAQFTGPSRRRLPAEL